MPGQAAGQHLNPQGALNDALAGGVRASPKPDGERGVIHQGSNDGETWIHLDGPCFSGCIHRYHRIVPDDSPTFAEAMALDPSEVEARWATTTHGDRWVPLTEVLHSPTHISQLRSAHYRRRSRPRRNRVEEMAGTFYDLTPAGEELGKYAERAMKVAIRSVCEYVRTSSVFDASIQKLAADIERHFLEPR